MKYCQNCGNQVVDDAILCTKCGFVIDENQFNKQFDIDKSNLDASINSSTQKTENDTQEKLFCRHCGKELKQDQRICMNCGCAVENNKNESKVIEKNNNETLYLVAKILMIISCVASAMYILPLCWMLPMTITFCNKVKNKEPISVGFIVCVLLFVNTISGILLLIAKDEQN